MFDPNWLSALKLPIKIIAGLLLASLILLALDWYAVFQLSAFGKSSKNVLIALSVIFGALTLTGIVGSFIDNKLARRRKMSLAAERKKQRAEEYEDEKTKSQSAAIARIDHLNAKELRVLADCLRDGSQSFYAYAHSSVVATLMQKNLVGTPGGQYHQDHYPYSIADFAWKALLERKKEILAKDEKNKEKEAAEKKRNRGY